MDGQSPTPPVLNKQASSNHNPGPCVWGQFAAATTAPSPTPYLLTPSVPFSQINPTASPVQFPAVPSIPVSLSTNIHAKGHARWYRVRPDIVVGQRYVCHWDIPTSPTSCCLSTWGSSSGCSLTMTTLTLDCTHAVEYGKGLH